VIIFLDIEHPKALEDTKYRDARAQTMDQRRRLFGELSGEACHVRHYSEFRVNEVNAADVTAVVTSGNRSLWEDYDLDHDFAEFAAVIRETQKPVLGICGGHQLIGMLFGGKAEPLRTLAPGEPDPNPSYAPGILKEWGFSDVNCTPSDPLFAGFNGKAVVNQMHFWHLTQLPDSLTAIASNRNCPVQALRHRTRPVYGVQFHPEFYDEQHMDGRRLLQNFFSLGAKQRT
jgi:GMP synthase-like glutamine amidotransferase